MNYEIINGNNIEVLRTFPDNHFDSVVTDPPYLIDFLGRAWDANDYDMTDAFKECLRVLKPGGYILAFSAAKTYHKTATMIESSGFEIRDQLMWLYSTKMPKGNNLKPAHEPIVMACKGKPNKLNIDQCRIPREVMTYPANGIKRQTFNEGMADKWQGETTTNTRGGYPHNVIGEVDNYQKYFYNPRASSKEKQAYNNHPTVKPIELMKYLIKLVTPDAGLVLDPFNGSGSTGCAAVSLGHEYVGIELDANYCEISKKRIEQIGLTID